MLKKKNFLKEYETTNSIMLKLMKKLRNLKNDSAIGFEKDKSKINNELQQVKVKILLVNDKKYKKIRGWL